MTEYHVVWRIELDADSPVEAAVQARQILLDPESEAVAFEVATFADWQSRGHRAAFTDVDLAP